MRIVHLGRGALRPTITYPGCILICVPQCFVSVKPGRDLVLITAYTAEEGGGGVPFERVPFSTFRHMYIKGWGFHALKYRKGYGNLPLRSVKKTKTANKRILWL